MKDNKVTTPTDFSEFSHSWSMDNDPKYKEEFIAKQKLLSEDLPMQDQSLTMALMASGLGPLASYSSAPIHAAGRVARAVVNKDPTRLLGTPTKSQLMSAIKAPGKDREKVLWQGTGNSVKLEQIDSNYK